MFDLDTIAATIANRFVAASVTPPAGYANVRSSTANSPGAIGPTPAVVVSANEGTFTTGDGSRQADQYWYVRFYFDQTSDLERTEPALRKWLNVLLYQLQTSAQLGGLVTRAVIESWRVGILVYGGVDYTGVELVVHTTVAESWAAAA